MNRHIEHGKAGMREESIFQQLKRVEQLAADIYAARTGRDGLTQRQYALLSSLSENEGASQAELVRRTGIDRSTLAELAARLESRGLLRRRRCRNDRRANELFLTRKGRDALEAMEPLMNELEELFLSALPPHLASAFREALQRLSLPETSHHLCEQAHARCRQTQGENAAREGTVSMRERRKMPLPVKLSKGAVSLAEVAEISR